VPEQWGIGPGLGRDKLKQPVTVGTLLHVVACCYPTYPTYSMAGELDLVAVGGHGGSLATLTRVD
jgi:hypothetical protein